MSNCLSENVSLCSTILNHRRSDSSRIPSEHTGILMRPGSQRDHQALVRGARIVGALVLMLGSHSRAVADSMPDSPATQIEEVDVTSVKQSALDAEAISLSDTPDAEPLVGGKTSIILGLAPRVMPAYEGSKTTKVIPFPYIDVHGLFHDRVFISDIRGVGFNIVDQGPFRAGMSLNYGGGRTSKDSPRLNGLPDISAAASAAAFATFSIKPFAFEFKVSREFGSQPGTEAELGATYAMAPTPWWHVSFGTQLNWHDAKFNQKYFGVTAAEATQATAVGNSMTAYVPGSGLGNVGITTTSVFALSKHWGIITRLGLREIIGSPAKDSPLTERTSSVDFAVGAAYKF